jgi:hypothetical protein
MKRFGAVAVLAGAVLLSTHILAPAEPPPAPPDVLDAEVAVAARDTPIVAQVDSEVERLRRRLNEPRAYPPPARDPFRFGAPSSRRPSAPTPTPHTDSPATPAPTLPHLIAIASANDDAEAGRIAILGLGDAVETLKPGDRFSTFRLERIDLDSVELSEPATGRTFRISLQ